MLRAYPHGEDNGNTAGGDSDNLRAGMGKPITLNARGMPPDVDRTTGTGVRADEDATMFEAAAMADTPPNESEEEQIDFLNLIRQAEEQSQLYLNQVNRRSWSQSLRAFHQEHFVGSKYTKPDWRNRSKIFRPKTRSAVRKDMAAVAASLFNNLDAIACLPGDESNPRQKASAAVLQALVNYRLDRNSPKVGIPWFHVSMGARQDSLLTGICVSKQSWKLDVTKRLDPEKAMEQGDDGVYEEVERDVLVPTIDRPDCQLIPPENIIIDPAADWTNPAQSASYLILKWPMRLDEIKKKMESPIRPWNTVSDTILLSSVENGKFDMSSVRRAREMGLDRLDETQTGQDFQVIWVYENFMRVGGEDWTFITVGDKEYLTDPTPVKEVYPEQQGDRPLVIGYGSLESHRIFPMSPVESWQQYQIELNDLANLTLDAIKQNVMPVTKVVRGRQIDMDQVKRRSSGTAIIVSEKDDVTWERPPDVPQSVPVLTRSLELELDDLAGQFNGSTAQDSNALSRTLGGLKLVSGSANAVQEFDIRIWIQSWCEPVLAQIVRLEQYYESDPVVLGLCGEKAQLMQKFGINKIDDELLEQEVTVRVSIGLGAGDPQQRFQKFAMATQLAMPLLAHAQEFKDGSLTIDPIAVMEELYGTAGYRDGGKRFIKKGNPQQNPLQDLEAAKLQSEIEKNKKTGSGSLLQGLAAVAKVALGTHELEAQEADSQLEHARADRQQTIDTAHAANKQILDAHDTGHRHGMEIMQHQTDAMKPEPQKTGPEGKPMGPPPAPPPKLIPPPPNPMQTPTMSPHPHLPDPGPPPMGMAGGPPPGGQQPFAQAAPPMPGASMPPPAAGRQMINAGLQRGNDGLLSGANVGGRQVVFIRDPHTNRIVGARVIEPHNAAPHDVPLPTSGVI